MCISRDEPPEYASVMQPLARNRVEVKESALLRMYGFLFARKNEMFDVDSRDAFAVAGGLL